jgi:hypothetical protein
LSVALPDTTTVLIAVVPATGAVTATVGEVVSLRVTVRFAVAVLAAPSRAVTVSTFEPSWRAIAVAFQLLVPVAVPLPPRLFHPCHLGHTDIVPGRALEGQRRAGHGVGRAGVGEVMVTVGGVVSEPAPVPVTIPAMVPPLATKLRFVLTVVVVVGVNRTVTA